MADSAYKQLHHINLVVPDLDEAAQQFACLIGTAPRPKEFLPKREVAIHRFLLGSVWLVLVSPTASSSPAAIWLGKHGPGLFLLSFATDDLEAALESLQKNGIDSDAAPRSGLDDWLVADLDPSAFFGIPIQLTQQRAQNGEQHVS